MEYITIINESELDEIYNKLNSIGLAAQLCGKGSCSDKVVGDVTGISEILRNGTMKYGQL